MPVLPAILGGKLPPLISMLISEWGFPIFFIVVCLWVLYKLYKNGKE